MNTPITLIQVGTAHLAQDSGNVTDTDRAKPGYKPGGL